MRKTWLPSVLWLVGVLVLVPPATADKSRSQPPGSNDPVERYAMTQLLLAQAHDEERLILQEGKHRARAERTQQRKHLEQLRMLKLLELLELDEDQEVPFLTAFNAMRKEQRELDSQIKRTLDTLADELHRSDKDRSPITGLVDRTLDMEKNKHRLTMAFVEQARTMLTVEQLGKFVIFQKRFECELLERLGRFRQERRNGLGRFPADSG